MAPMENFSLPRREFLQTSAVVLFLEVLCADHLNMTRNTVAWATDETPAVRVDGPGLFDVTAWRNPGSITVHMVNMTNPMAMKGPYRGFFPVGEQTVTLNLPEIAHARQARLLAADRMVPVEHMGSTLTVKVPTVLDHEVVAIEV